MDQRESGAGIKTGPPEGDPETGFSLVSVLVVIAPVLVFVDGGDCSLTNGTFLQQRAEWPLKSSAAKTLSSKGIHYCF